MEGNKKLLIAGVATVGVAALTGLGYLIYSSWPLFGVSTFFATPAI